MNSKELINLPLKEYFEYFNDSIRKNMGLEFLGNLFTELPFKEYKPYLIRRSLIPNDSRFQNIEIVYDDSNNYKLKAIAWHINITLRELIIIFGRPKHNYCPYDESVEFAFSSSNPEIEIIKTRLSVSKFNKIEYKKQELVNQFDIEESTLALEFSFIQFNLVE